jgi:hypothetical protein
VLPVHSFDFLLFPLLCLFLILNHGKPIKDI